MVISVSMTFILGALKLVIIQFCQLAYISPVLMQITYVYIYKDFPISR